MCKINGMLLQLIQVAGIHVIQSRSPEAGFSKGLIQQSQCMWGASPAWHGQQGFVTAEDNCVGLDGCEPATVLTEKIPVPCSVNPKVSANGSVLAAQKSPVPWAEPPE